MDFITRIIQVKVYINTNRACLRFYGDEKISYYMAHDRKDLDGIVEDKVLDYLDENQTVMHDHNKVNYNERFFFNNIECNQHLQRDLKKNGRVKTLGSLPIPV